MKCKVNTSKSETDILHMDMMGSHIIVFSDSDVTADVVERRSAVYADRVCNHLAAMTFTLTST